MKCPSIKILTLSAFTTISSLSHASSLLAAEAAITLAVEYPARLKEDVKRDIYRKPAEIL